jgi:hypothetical protein
VGRLDVNKPKMAYRRPTPKGLRPPWTRTLWLTIDERGPGPLPCQLQKTPKKGGELSLVTTVEIVGMLIATSPAEHEDERILG